MPCKAVPVSQANMERFYAINPPRHAEKAYQPNQGDLFPTLSTVPTTAGPTGQIILLVTTLRNQPEFRQAQAQVVDYDSLLRFNGGSFPSPEQAQKIIGQHPEIVAGDCSFMTPFAGIVFCEPNSRVTVRVLTGGMKAKALSIESFQASGGQL